MQGTEITVIGNIARDPEMRYTPSGIAVAKFAVAVNKRVKDGDDWKDGDPSFFDVECWRDLAEHVSESFQKGHRVIVQGRMEQQRWEDEDGNKRSKMVVTADEVGASVRWATVAIQKIERSGSDGGARTSRSGPSQKNEQAAAADIYGEEPF